MAQGLPAAANYEYSSHLAISITRKPILSVDGPLSTRNGAAKPRETCQATVLTLLQK
jgi:hypothetical protein